MSYIPDAYDLWEAQDIEKSKKLERLPKCFHCGEPVQQEMAVHLDIGWLCEECINNNMEDVIDDAY